MSWKDILKESDRPAYDSIHYRMGGYTFDSPDKYIMPFINDDILSIEIADDEEQNYQGAETTLYGNKVIELGNINSKSFEEFEKEIDRININNLEIDYLDFMDLEDMIDYYKSR